jgi:hypothetical protein
MINLIPRLEELCFAQNPFGVDPGFVEVFVKIHQLPNQLDGGWRSAEEHWEGVVRRVLNTDAVTPNATGRAAIEQAVMAAVEPLQRLAVQGRCPMCIPRISRPQQDAIDQEGAR